MVIIPLLVIELKATPNGNRSNDFNWKQKSSFLNVVQYNTTSRSIIFHLQIYIALPENLINRATLEYVPGLTYLTNDFYWRQKSSSLNLVQIIPPVSLLYFTSKFIWPNRKI